jgi:hypothetical protein
MSRDGQGTGPDESPMPPASTRWSSPDAGDDADVLPPFVPGRRPTSDEPVADTTDVVADTTELVSETVEPEPVTTPEPEADWFPFDEPQAADEPAVADEPESDDEPFPWADEAADEWPEAAGADARTSGQVWSTAFEAEIEDLEAAPEEVDGDADTDPALDLADRLEALAGRLRDRGAAGVESDMASPDRMTALLAGLIAGYLAAREG